MQIAHSVHNPAQSKFGSEHSAVCRNLNMPLQSILSVILHEAGIHCWVFVGG